MSYKVFVFFEWINTREPLTPLFIHTLKDITKQLKKQYREKLNIYSNNEEAIFLSTMSIQLIPLLTYSLIKENPSLHIKNYNSNDKIIWITFKENGYENKFYKNYPLKSWNDFCYTNQLTQPKKKEDIIIRADGGIKLGSGHLYRVLSLYYLLKNSKIEQNIYICTMDNIDLNIGKIFFEEKKIPYRIIHTENDFVNLLKNKNPILVVLDILDISSEYLLKIKPYTKKIISFENIGNALPLLDLTFNDLIYNNQYTAKNQLKGLSAALLNPVFFNIKKINTFRSNVQHILISMGGTDPSNSTLKILEALELIKYTGKVIVIQNYNQKKILKHYSFHLEIISSVAYMPQYMANIDYAFTGGGRTILELIKMCVPTISIAQNTKELMHTHTQIQYGVLQIGLAKFLTVENIAQYAELLIENKILRKQLYTNTTIARKQLSNTKILKKILQLIQK